MRGRDEENGPTRRADDGALRRLATPAVGRSSDFLTSTESRLAGTTLSLAGRGDTEVLHRIHLRGRVPIPGPDRWVTVTVKREGKVVRTRTLRADPVTGTYRMRVRLKGCCDYVAQAVHGSDVSNSVPFEATVPQELEDGRRQTLLFNRLLRRSGYHMGEEVTDQEDEATGLAIMAMRKVHDMPRTESYDPALFELLLRNEAAFEPVHTEDGRHVEVDISRQVMALVSDGEATDVFHVSTGAGGTPTGRVELLRQGPRLQRQGHVLLGLLRRQLRHPRLLLGADVPRQPRLHPQLDRLRGLRLQLDRAGRHDLRLLLSATPWRRRPRLPRCAGTSAARTGRPR